jgi:glycosyltransferase involved in cell wall biosynthesis
LDIQVFLRAVFLAGVLKDQNIDHIHVPWADISAFISLVASRLLGVPYSVGARAHDLHRTSFLYALREKFSNAAFVVTHARYNEPYLRKLLPKQWGKIHVIYTGVRLPQFEPPPKKSTVSTPVKLLCVARLIEQKGLLYLLEACKILKDRRHRFKCQIIGAPEEPLYARYHEDLQRLHKELALEDCVYFLGPRPFAKVLDKYKTADIFILPCVIAEDGSRDITPNALIEAMAMRLPVISTTVTAIPEIVDDGISGLLVPPHNPKALAEAVLRLSSDFELRNRLGEQARAKVESVFDINKNASGYVDLFTAAKF